MQLIPPSGNYPVIAERCRVMQCTINNTLFTQQGGSSWLEALNLFRIHCPPSPFQSLAPLGNGQQARRSPSPLSTRSNIPEESRSNRNYTPFQHGNHHPSPEQSGMCIKLTLMVLHRPIQHSEKAIAHPSGLTHYSSVLVESNTQQSLGLLSLIRNDGPRTCPSGISSQSKLINRIPTGWLELQKCSVESVFGQPACIFHRSHGGRRAPVQTGTFTHTHTHQQRSFSHDREN